jgi:translation initiation factor 2B subunit (eIF-2B alpha/beta/delta family)
MSHDENRMTRGIAALGTDRRHGASELAIRAVRLFRSAHPRAGEPPARYRRRVRRLAMDIAKARPSMAPIEGAVRRLIFDFEKECSGARDSAGAYACLSRCSESLLDEMRRLNGRVADRYAARFRAFKRLMLISFSSQVLAAVMATRRASVAITVCESRPGLEGRRLAAALAGHARSTTLVTEAEIAMAMDACDALVLGSDAIATDGSIVNKTGSRVAALVARDARRPVIAIGDTFKLLGRRRAVDESHAAREVWPGAPRGVRVRNVYFESVPARLIDYIVLESGVWRPRAMQTIWRRVCRGRATW